MLKDTESFGLRLSKRCGTRIVWAPAPPGDWYEPEGVIRLLMLGESDGGRRILVVFAWPAHANYGNGITQIFTDRARPITAYRR